MIEHENNTILKTVFTYENWENWTLEDFWSENGINWEQVTLDQDLFDDLENSDWGWDEWDHNTRMMELDDVAYQTEREMTEKNMEVSIERDENCEEIFILGINRDLIPIARALLLWN